MNSDCLITCISCKNNQGGYCSTLFQIVGKKMDDISVNCFNVLQKHFLFTQGELNSGLFILKSGWVLLSRIAIDGKRQVIKIVLPGEILGIQPDMHAPAIYSAYAITNSVVCSLPSALELCSTYPELALQLVWASATDMLIVESYLEKISHHSAKERIAFMVLEIFNRLKLKKLNKENTFQFPLKQQDIADMLGLTTVHVNRTLHYFNIEGIFTIKNHELKILNYDKLNQFVDFEMLN